jgi:hypothetical protein
MAETLSNFLPKGKETAEFKYKTQPKDLYPQTPTCCPSAARAMNLLIPILDHLRVSNPTLETDTEKLPAVSPSPPSPALSTYAFQYLALFVGTSDHDLPDEEELQDYVELQHTISLLQSQIHQCLENLTCSQTRSSVLVCHYFHHRYFTFS